MSFAQFSKGVDFGRAAAEYRNFRAGFPPAFFAELVRRGVARPGERALDLGTGTGTIARGLALLGLHVTGIDPAAAMLAEAAILDRESGAAVDYRVGRAEATGLPGAHFDLVTAGQCWHWFDRSAVAREVNRLLVPGGRVVIAHFDWLPLPDNIVEMTERLIRAANPDWSMHGGSGIYPPWLTDLAVAGFTGLETFSFDIDQRYSHEAWRGRIRASAGIKASLEPDAVARFDAVLAKCLAERFPAEPLTIPHRVWAVTGVRPSMRT